MATQINVTVDGGGLLEQAKQQTNANRLAQVEKERQAKVKRQADAINLRRSQASLTEQEGRPPAFLFKRIEPAAQRRRRFSVAHWWLKTRSTPSAQPVGEGLVFVPDAYGGGISRSQPYQAVSQWPVRPSATQTRNYFCGTGYPGVVADVVSIPSTTPLPTASMAWNYGGDAGIIFYQSAAFWYCKGRGVRTAALTRGYEVSNKLLSIPVGGKQVIVLHFYQRTGKDVDVTIMHEAIGGPPFAYGGTIDDIPEYVLQAQRDSFRAEYGYAGATVPAVGPSDPESNWVRTVVADYDYTKTKAYLIDSTNAKEIAVPAYFNDYNLIEYLPSGVPKLPLFASQTLDMYPSENGSADIFYRLNTLKQFVDPARIKRFTLQTSAAAVAKDRSKGAYSNEASLFDEDRPFYYKHKRENKDSFDLGSKAQLVLSPNRDRTAYDTDELTFVYDNDARAYCRSMCLAIGFTEPDLTP